MTPTELEPRLAPSASPFPEVPSLVLYLASGDTLTCALAPGGPRVVRQDAAGDEVWSVYVADPLSRGGVNVDAVKLLAAASGERVVAESETPAVVPPEPGVDPLANSITRGFGLFDGATVGVGLVFDTRPGPSEREQQDRLFLPQDVWDALADSGKVDPYSVYVAVGDEVTRARSLGRYVEVELSGPGPFDVAAIAADVLGRLA